MTIVQENYRNLKKCYPKHILLYRVGKFYYAYGGDAEMVGAKRVADRKVEECIGSLLKRGYKVAVAEGVKMKQEALFQEL